jgi:hypothetical protein
MLNQTEKILIKIKENCHGKEIRFNGSDAEETRP